MYNVSNDFKTAILNNARRINAYIEIDGSSYSIQKCTLDMNIYNSETDAFIGTFIAKSGTLKVNKQDSLQLENESFNLFFGIQLADETNENVPIGAMNVYEKTSDTEYKFMDNKMFFNKTFDTTKLTYPTTPLLAAQEACRQAGVELATTDFPNKNLSIPSEVFFGYDATCTDVIVAVAQASCTFATINRNNELEFKWFNKVDFTVPLDNQYTYPIIEVEYGPINSLVLAREPQNDNVYIQDEDSIELNGLTELKISNNPFLDIDRYNSRTAIWNRINGFSYKPYIANMPGYFHLDPGDIIDIQIEDKSYIDAYVLNHTLEYSGGIKSNFSTPALSKSQINYNIASSIENKLHQTELLVDKINGEIKASIKDIEIKLDATTGVIISDEEPGEPIKDMKWLDTSTQPNILKIYDGEKWISASDYTGKLEGIDASISNLETSLSMEQGKIDALIEESTIIVDGEEVSVKETVENMVIGIDGITNTIKTTSGNNLIRDSIGCFNDGSWDGDYNIDSTLETRSRNMYGYALLLKKSTLQQEITVANGVYTLSFTYKKLVNLARVTLTINGTEYILSNNDFTVFTRTFEVSDGQINISFICDTDNACLIINLMLNKGDSAMEWSLNPNETWGDTVKIGRGVRISSTGTDVVFVALADIIGFMDKQGNYITTFDDEGFVTNTAVIKNKATIVNLLIQEVNGQTIINKINPNEVNEVEVLKNGK